MAEPSNGATPGPWNVRSDPDANVVFVESEVPFQLVIATCGKANSPVAQANARLIAKARHLPALIDALEAAIPFLREHTICTAMRVDGNAAECQAHDVAVRALALVQETE